jgi:hypothetical protein
VSDDLDDFGRWYEEGVRRGWITPMFCLSHDGVPFTKQELGDDAEGTIDLADTCITTIRVLEGDADMAYHPRWGDNMREGFDETA